MASNAFFPHESYMFDFLCSTQTTWLDLYKICYFSLKELDEKQSNLICVIQVETHSL